MGTDRSGFTCTNSTLAFGPLVSLCRRQPGASQCRTGTAQGANACPGSPGAGAVGSSSRPWSWLLSLTKSPAPLAKPEIVTRGDILKR